LAEKGYINKLKLLKEKNTLYIEFVVENCFHKKVIEAIKSGFPVTFIFQIELKEQKNIWPDSIIIKKMVKHSIKFDNMKEIYKVKLEKGKEIELKDISKAKGYISHLKLPIINVSSLESGKVYKINSQVKLEPVELPSPLKKTIFFFSSPWDFETRWYSYEFSW